MKRLIALILASITIPTIASAAYVSPSLAGLAPQYFSWNGQRWSNNSGQVWNTHVPYAIEFDGGKFRSEVHDTINDRGQSDPSQKRRAEIHQKYGLNNGVVYWHAFTTITHSWPCAACQKQAGGYAIQQVHMPGGGSPAISFRRFANGTFGVTTNPGGNVKRLGMALSFDVPHDIVYRFVLSPSGSTAGQLDVWVDGIHALHLAGVAIGGNTNGYYLTLGNYSGAPLSGNVLVEEYANVVPTPTTLDLSARIASAPAWPN